MNTDALRQHVVSAFRERYERNPAVLAFAPGRIEVLGNHTDYNEGLVLAAAIEAGLCLAAAPVETGASCRLTALDLGREVVFPAENPGRDPEESWSHYSRGVLHGLREKGILPPPFDALFAGSLPIGSGLSSSAALEVATALALTKLAGQTVDRLALARIAQRAEWDFAGVRCGLLDQMASLFGETGRLIALDFRDLSRRSLPFPNGAAFLLCNSHVRHNLVDSEYNDRRMQCEQAAAFFAGALGRPVRALRDVSSADLAHWRDHLDETTARRAAHVIGETERVREADGLLRAGDLSAFGALMFASHQSSVTDFENSTPELDLLVHEARNLPGVYGARLSGGGFGGNVVVLLREESGADTARRLAALYRQHYGQHLDARLFHPAQGARLLA